MISFCNDAATAYTIHGVCMREPESQFLRFTLGDFLASNKPNFNPFHTY